jgi:hypothetical protein
MDHDDALLDEPFNARVRAGLHHSTRSLAADPVVCSKIRRLARPWHRGGQVHHCVTARETGSERLDVEYVCCANVGTCLSKR